MARFLPSFLRQHTTISGVFLTSCSPGDYQKGSDHEVFCFVLSVKTDFIADAPSDNHFRSTRQRTANGRKWIIGGHKRTGVTRHAFDPASSLGWVGSGLSGISRNGSIGVIATC
ncbi:hypothetical protein [Sphingobium sp. Leaf26]|uniref:hypothetical protein n=1 Tax=Sphingobium sp. Leaf26 TaxID=1735693 RepID=UPI00138F93CD|nr:hypothetical protein [Sphingobium sp. Leaf26]